MLTKEDLINFEKEIADVYATGIIKAPVHLRSGREDALIDIFSNFKIGSNDYVFGYWDSHELALLKGVPREAVKASILAGNSIALSFPVYNVLCSGIVGSLMGVAVGVAWALKQRSDHLTKHGMINVNAPKVYHFCGEMSAETGIFHEAVKYAHNFELPIKFIVSDNDVSVMTKTRDVWGHYKPWFQNGFIQGDCFWTLYADKIIYFKYKNGYPHSGLGKLIKF